MKALALIAIVIVIVGIMRTAYSNKLSHLSSRLAVVEITDQANTMNNILDHEVRYRNRCLLIRENVRFDAV